MRNVYDFSRAIAARRRNSAFLIIPSRLSEIEGKGSVPNIYKLYTLSVVYHRGLRILLGLYGLD